MCSNQIANPSDRHSNGIHAVVRTVYVVRVNRIERKRKDLLHAWLKCDPQIVVELHIAHGVFTPPPDRHLKYVRRGRPPPKPHSLPGHCTTASLPSPISEASSTERTRVTVHHAARTARTFKAPPTQTSPFQVLALHRARYHRIERSTSAETCGLRRASLLAIRRPRRLRRDPVFCCTRGPRCRSVPPRRRERPSSCRRTHAAPLARAQVRVQRLAVLKRVVRRRKVPAR